MAIMKGYMEYKLVVVVRDDLNMKVGKLAAQVAHAAVTCTLEAKAKKTKWFSEWYKEGQRKVVLRAADLEELRALSCDLGLERFPLVHEIAHFPHQGLVVVRAV